MFKQKVFKDVLKGLQTNRVSRSGRNRQVLLAVLQGAVVAASNTLLATPNRESLSSYSQFELPLPWGRRIFFWGETYPFLTTPCTAPGHLWSEKWGTWSQLICVTGLFPALGSQFTSKWRNDHFFPSKIRYICHQKVSWVSQLLQLGSFRCSVHSFRTMTLFLPYSYFTKWCSYI